MSEADQSEANKFAANKFEVLLFHSATTGKDKMIGNRLIRMFGSGEYAIVVFLGVAIWFAGAEAPSWAAPPSGAQPPANAPSANAPSENAPSENAPSKSAPSANAPPSSQSNQLDEGINLCRSGKYQEAISYFQKYVATAPNDARGYFWLGTAYLDVENYAQAEPHLRKAISLLPENIFVPELHVNLGNALLELNKTDEAIQQYQLALKINPKEPRAHLNLARALIDKGSPIDAFVAIDELKKTEQLGLKLSSMLSLQAKANVNLGNFKEARSLMTDFLATIPNDADSQDRRKAVQAIIESIDNIISKRDQAAVPTPPQKRHYELKSGTQYIITKMDKDRHLVTMASSDKQDPDGGKQDGFNDGIFEMPDSELNQQVKERGEVWRRSETSQ